MLIWPLRRFAIERRSLAAAYGSLAAYAAMIPAHEAIPPEPHTFAGTASPLADPQPFARSGEVFVFQALLDEAERIRASLAAFAVHYEHLGEADHPARGRCATCRLRRLRDRCRAQGCEGAAGTAWFLSVPRRLRERLSSRPSEPLLGQIRAAWRTAGVLTAVPEIWYHGGNHIAKVPRYHAMREP